jgi:hypothetical protein
METWTNPGRYYTPEVPRRVVGRRDFSALSTVKSDSPSWSDKGGLDVRVLGTQAQSTAKELR